MSLHDIPERPNTTYNRSQPIDIQKRFRHFKDLPQYISKGCAREQVTTTLKGGSAALPTEQIAGAAMLDNGSPSFHAGQTKRDQQTNGGLLWGSYRDKIHEHSEFQRWREDTRLLWVTGRPGAGKSTLIRDLHASRKENFWKSFRSLVAARAERKALEILEFSSASREYFVKGILNGNPVEALPDSGADMCFISPKLASNLGLRLATGSERKIQIANKKHVQSPGMVEAPWRFAREEKAHILKCWILPGCVHDLVLGNDFLKVTQTLTTFKNRIKSKLVELPRRLRLRLLGEEKQRLWGFLDGHLTTAMPDTGSDVMLISRAYAQRIGLTIDRGFENWLEVEFADGTTDWTSGVVRNVPWDVGGKTVRCDFHVLDDLCVDVILSKDYLFDLNVFSEYSNCFYNTSPEDNFSQLCNIRLIGRYGDALNILDEEYLEDVASPNAFGPDMVRRELARRDLIRDEISALPENEREAAVQAEARRQHQWEDLRQAHQARWRTASSVLRSSGHDNNHGTETDRDRTRASEGPPTEAVGDCLHGAATGRELQKKKGSLISIALKSLRRESTRFLVRR